MKRKINNKTYNTDTANLIGNYFYIQRNCSRILCYLFKKRNGEYFIKCRGGDKTYHQWYDFLTDTDAYREPLYNQYFIGDFIVPLVTNEDIEYYSKLAMNNND